MNTNFKKMISIALFACLVLCFICLTACKDDEPKETTPEEVVTTTTPEETPTQPTTPEETTPAGPTETVTFPSDEDDDPKQEDVFFD